MRGGKKGPEPTVQDTSDAKIAALLAQVQHLEAQLDTYKEDTNTARMRNNYGRGGKSGLQRRRKRFQCTQCQRDNSVCFHCSKCDDVGHYGANCTKNE